jgi:hypothetical protein
VSKTSVFVQAVDGNRYKNPLLYGVNWYVCFDDEDDPEIVIKSTKSSTVASMMRRAKKVLHRSAINGKVISQAKTAHRLFPPMWDKLTPTMSFFLALGGPIPIPETHEGYISPPFTDDAKCICWEMIFPTRRILDVFLPGITIDLRLIEFVIGYNHYKFTNPEIVLAETLIEWLGDDFKTIVTHPERSYRMIEAKYGETITLRKPETCNSK